MTLKSRYIDQERRNDFSYKRENTLKSMEFSKVMNTFVHLDQGAFGIIEVDF